MLLGKIEVANPQNAVVKFNITISELISIVYCVMMTVILVKMGQIIVKNLVVINVYHVTMVILRVVVILVKQIEFKPQIVYVLKENMISQEYQNANSVISVVILVKILQKIV